MKTNAYSFYATNLAGALNHHWNRQSPAQTIVYGHISKSIWSVFSITWMANYR